MNKTAIKNFAIWARNKLRADISYRAGLMGITEKGIADALPQSTLGAEFYDIGAAEPYLAYSEGEALASADGEVMSVARDAVGRATVRLRHDSGMETLYGNLIAASVREGDRVKAGQVLGVSRALVYEMRAEGLPTDPAPYLQ